MLKNILKKIIPASILNKIRVLKSYSILFKNYLYDMKRFAKHSLVLNSPSNADQLLSKIIVQYHIIEKGMALKDTRLGYAKAPLAELFSLLQKYVDRGYSKDNIHFQAAIGALKAYVAYHEGMKYDVAAVKEQLQAFDKYYNNAFGGKIDLTKSEVLQAGKSNFEEFANNRFSVRNFSGEPVDMKLIYNAIRLAQKTPSVCNRQTSRVYVISDDEAKKKLQQLQQGNRGFGHIVDKYLIVTSDLNYFHRAGDRNQSFVDGGLYAMSLLYGLHYEGLAACTLNWAVTKEDDMALRQRFKIKDSENIILVIAIGHYPEQFTVAKSTRQKAEEITTVI
jgi:nitroreductase